MQIYLARDGVQAGPYTLDEFNQVLTDGQVLSTDLMWHIGMSEWARVGDVVGGAPLYQPQDAPISLNQALNQDQAQNPIQNTPSTPTQNQNAHLTLAQKNNDVPMPTPIDPNAGITFARIVAIIINLALYFIAASPIIVAASRVIKKVARPTSGNIVDSLAYGTRIGERMMAEQGDVATIGTWAVMALFLVQILLIIIRSQSLGKLFMGLHLIQPDGKKAGAFAALLRALVLFVLYYLVMTFFSPMVLVMVVVHFWGVGKTGVGWHDKLTRTRVIRHKAPMSSSKYQI